MDKIKAFLESDKTDLNIPVQPYQTICNKLAKLGWKPAGMATNGWEHDFCAYFRKGDKIITFSGSWAWGKYYLSKKIKK